MRTDEKTEGADASIKEVYEITYNSVYRTFETQLETVRALRDRSLAIIKINLLILGAIVSSFAIFAEIETNMYLLATFFRFYCLFGYVFNHMPLQAQVIF
jgi:uncharacterized membrane protein